MTWGANSPGWWGEGEIKFYMDGDTEFPTICGTGTEDYFCGSYGFDNPKGGGYQTFSGPYAGMPQVINPEGQAGKKDKGFRGRQICRRKNGFQSEGPAEIFPVSLAHNGPDKIRAKT